MEYKLNNFDQHLENKLERIEQDPGLSPRNKEIILRYLRDSSIGKTVNKGQKREISAGRNLQVAGFLMRMAKDWFKKDLDKVTQEDMEKLIGGLNKGQITTSERAKKKSLPYSSETKANIKKFIRKFYKWLLTGNKYFPDLVEWIDTSRPETLVSAIKGLDKGVWNIVELIPDIRRKALVWVCFDSGFREAEILSCKISDVEKRKDGYYYITCRQSKTKLRTVSLPLSSELLERWLEQHPENDNPDCDLWLTSRVMLYKTVKLYSKKALDCDATVHMLRHTSATYYAPKLDRTTFCKRFGWSYSSKTPDRYIDFAKVTESKVIDVIKGERLTEMSHKLGELTLENQALKEKMLDMENQIKNLTPFMETLREVYKNKKLKGVLEKAAKK